MGVGVAAEASEQMRQLLFPSSAMRCPAVLIISVLYHPAWRMEDAGRVRVFRRIMQRVAFRVGYFS